MKNWAVALLTGRLLLHVWRKTAALDHEILDHTMKNGAIVEAVADVTEKVLDRDRGLVGIEFESNVTMRCTHEDLGVFGLHQSLRRRNGPPIITARCS